jgi:putative tricarboxylic transport membrane protein
VFSVNFSVFDIWLLVIFGLLGYGMRKLDIPPAPLVLAFVLGPIAENSIRQSLLLSDNSPLIYLQRPISAVLIGLSVMLLLVLSVGRRARTVREQMIDIDA